MNDIVKFFLSVSTIGVIVGYLAKVIVDKILDARIEKYKSGLNNESEKFKSELNRINIEHQIKYSRLHEERAQKIKVLHDILYEAEIKLRHLTSTNQGSEWLEDDDRAKSVKEKITELTEALELNRIYFPDELCEKIENMIGEFWSIVRKMDKAKRQEKQNQYLNKSGRSNLINDPNQYLDTWTESEKYVLNEMKGARLILVNEFRQLIGV